MLHFSGGNLLDKDYEVFSRPDDKLEAVSSLLKQFYLSRGIAPKRVLLPFEIDDGELFAELLEQQYGRRPKLHVPSGATICVWWSWPAKTPLRKLSVSPAGKSGSARR